MKFFQGSAGNEYWFREGCWITEWANEADSGDLSIARARVAPGATTRWHALTDITERYVILGGTGRAEIGARGIDVAPGDVVVIEPGEPQRIANTGEEDLVFLAVCTPRFRPEAYCETEPENRE
jgi:mannose-6-phosphate isomerase-like protein (cupin superfamily)